MDEEKVLGEEEQEAAEPAEYMESEENQEVAEPDERDSSGALYPQNDRADGEDSSDASYPQNDRGRNDADAAFARMRRELEESRRTGEVLKQQNERFKKVLEPFGFKGETADDIADMAQAHFEGRSVEDVRSAREAEEREKEEIRTLKAENTAFKQREAQRVFEEDLRTLRKLDPKIKSIDEMGRDFFVLRAQGVSTEVAYNAIRGAREAEKVVPPQKIGRINAQTKAEKDYYSGDELDRLTAEQLDDPRVLERAIRSMTKLR